MAGELDAVSNEDSTRRAQVLADQFRSLAGPDRVVLQKRLGQDAIREAQEGVRKSRDPYGNTWAPLTSRTGQPLRRTGNNIQRSWTAGGETPDSFRFGSRFRYLATHQYGAVIRPVRAKALRFGVEGQAIYASTSRGIRQVGAESRFVYARKVTIPRRQLVPEQSTGGIGPKWMKSFAAVVNRYVREKMKEVG